MFLNIFGFNCFNYYSVIAKKEEKEVKRNNNENYKQGNNNDDDEYGQIDKIECRKAQLNKRKKKL